MGRGDVMSALDQPLDIEPDDYGIPDDLDPRKIYVNRDHQIKRLDPCLSCGRYTACDCSPDTCPDEGNIPIEFCTCSGD